MPDKIRFRFGRVRPPESPSGTIEDLEARLVLLTGTGNQPPAVSMAVYADMVWRFHRDVGAYGVNTRYGEQLLMLARASAFRNFGVARTSITSLKVAVLRIHCARFQRGAAWVLGEDDQPIEVDSVTLKVGGGRAWYWNQSWDAILVSNRWGRSFHEAVSLLHGRTRESLLKSRMQELETELHLTRSALQESEATAPPPAGPSIFDQLRQG